MQIIDKIIQHMIYGSEYSGQFRGAVSEFKDIGPEGVDIFFLKRIPKKLCYHTQHFMLLFFSKFLQIRCSIV